MIGVAVLCVLLITYFNFRSAGQQRENFTERVGDGQTLYEYTYPSYFQEEDISPHGLAQQEPAGVAILLWASWSDRSVEALEELQRLAGQLSEASESQTGLHILAAAIKDGEDFIEEIREQTADGKRVHFVKGDEIYNELRLPGLPAVVVFDAEGTLFGARYGYSSAEDFGFIKRLNE